LKARAREGENGRKSRKAAKLLAAQPANTATTVTRLNPQEVRVDIKLTNATTALQTEGFYSERSSPYVVTPYFLDFDEPEAMLGRAVRRPFGALDAGALSLRKRLRLLRRRLGWARAAVSPPGLLNAPSNRFFHLAQRERVDAEEGRGCLFGRTSSVCGVGAALWVDRSSNVIQLCYAGW
jgi:hypothetical protein